MITVDSDGQHNIEDVIQVSEALACGKNMYYDYVFPNFQDPVIYFQSYPLGSAEFIWYVCRCVGCSEGITMFVQKALILSCVLPFFMLAMQVNHGKGIAYIIAGLMRMNGVCCGSNMSNGPFHLLVDKLLAYIAIAAFVILSITIGNSWKKV